MADRPFATPPFEAKIVPREDLAASVQRLAEIGRWMAVNFEEKSIPFSQHGQPGKLSI